MSDELDEPESTGAESRFTRRRFIVEASALATSLAACGPGETTKHAPNDSTALALGQVAGQAPKRSPTQNADSRADTSLHHAMPTSSATTGTPPNVAFHRFDPALPPVSKTRVTQLHFTARDAAIRIRDDTVVSAWTFEGDVLGPIVHVRQGDTVEFTLTNAGQIPHSMDFHAAVIDPKVAFRSVVPGQSVTYTFKPRQAGAFLYHCGTAPVLMHIGSGMFGTIIVDPPTPPPCRAPRSSSSCRASSTSARRQPTRSTASRRSTCRPAAG
jgi:FtsP/CotA-like multicopper oxidase with cupredoxin domain